MFHNKELFEKCLVTWSPSAMIFALIDKLILKHATQMF